MAMLNNQMVFIMARSSIIRGINMAIALQLLGYNLLVDDHGHLIISIS